MTVKGALTEGTVVEADIEACGDTIVHKIDAVLVPCVPGGGENFCGQLLFGMFYFVACGCIDGEWFELISDADSSTTGGSDSGSDAGSG